MLDINLFREEKGGDPELVRESQRKRFDDVSLVDKVIELDQMWREADFNMVQANTKKKAISKQIGQYKKNKEEPPAELYEQSKALDDEVKANRERTAELQVERDNVLNKIGNIVSTEAIGNNEAQDSIVVKTWGEPREQTDLDHHHIMQMLEMYDGVRGANMVGHRGYFLTGPGVLLNQALISFALAKLTGKGYTAIQPPFFMKQSVMAKTAQLEDFDEELYHVSASNDDPESEDKYLIATSEQPISAYHMNEWLSEKDLPKRYAGYSTCFRKEAGKHGKDAWGIFRIHQFEKVEQFIICDPEESEQAHEEMLEVAEEFYQELGLPYRVIDIASGHLNNAAAKKYDLEAWFPTLAEYRELVSCSNCTDYQSRNLEIRYGQKKKGDHQKNYVHMLNGTMCATERTLCCIVENYYTRDYVEEEGAEPQAGLVVPDALQPFMGGVKFLPFTAKLDKKELKNIANREKKRAEQKERDAKKKEEEEAAAEETGQSSSNQ